MAGEGGEEEEAAGVYKTNGITQGFIRTEEQFVCVLVCCMYVFSLMALRIRRAALVPGGKKGGGQDTHTYVPVLRHTQTHTIPISNFSNTKKVKNKYAAFSLSIHRAYTIHAISVFIQYTSLRFYINKYSS